MIRKFLNIVAFFKSTLVINLSLSIVSILFGGVINFTIVLLSFGFIVSIAIKEIKQKNEYLFYYNNGISKQTLLLFSYLLTVMLLGIITIIRNFILSYFG